jgi:hypothetical protein
MARWCSPTATRRAIKSCARVRPTEEGCLAGKPKQAEKTFSLHWGSGVIEEEAQCATAYHQPTIQLLKFTEGEAKGAYALRFCHYDHRGRFQRAPLIVDATDLAKLKTALKATPKLRKLLGKLG